MLDIIEGILDMRPSSNSNGGGKVKSWTFVRETSIPDSIHNILVGDEEALSAYTTVRDVCIFTTKRVIVSDSQGITGKKVETYSIPYHSVMNWSTETAGSFLDFTSELTLNTLAGSFKFNLKAGIDVSKLDRLLAENLL